MTRAFVQIPVETGLSLTTGYGPADLKSGFLPDSIHFQQSRFRSSTAAARKQLRTRELVFRNRSRLGTAYGLQ